MAGYNSIVSKVLSDFARHKQDQGAADAAPMATNKTSPVVSQVLAAWEADKQRKQVELPTKIQEIGGLLSDWDTGYNQALAEYNGRYWGRTGGYKDGYLHDTASALEGYRIRSETLRDTAKQITGILDTYGDYMNEEAVGQIRKQLREGSKNLEGMEKAYKDSADFFSSFADESEYTKWQDTTFRTGEAQYQERLDWYDESKNKLSKLEDIDKQYTQLMQKGIQNASGGIYYDGGRYSPGYNSRGVAQKPSGNKVMDSSYGKEAAAFLKQNGFESIAQLRSEIEELKAERTRYERGEGEWASYDEKTGLQTGFRNFDSDRNLAKLQDKSFMEGAKKEAGMANIPTFEELAQMDALIYDNGFTMDLDENGQTVAYSSVDGSRLIQDKDGNFHHAMEKDARYTGIDRLGVYLSADSDQKAKESLHGAISTWDNIKNQGIASHWDFLTPEEVSIYYGLKASSKQEADAYLQNMQSTLNHRYENAKAVGTVEEYEKSGWLHRARMQGRAIVEQGLSGLGNLVVMVDSAINDKEIDAYSATYSGTRYANTVRGTEARLLDEKYPGKILGMSAGDLYNATMSAVDSALYNAIPVVGTAMTAAAGSAGDVVDKYAQGASQDQIIRSAAANFAIELATESAGYEKLKLFKEMDVHTWSDWLLNTLKQGGTELLEEGTSYVVNGVADIINRRSQSEWTQIWNKHEGNVGAAFGEVLGELLKNGLSGFISGILGGGFGTIRSTARNTAQTRNIGRAVQTTEGGVEGLKNYASTIALNGNDKGLDRAAGKLREVGAAEGKTGLRWARGKITDSINTGRAGKLYRMTEASVREQNKAELAKTLQEKGYSEKQAQQIAEAAVSSAAGWRLTEKQQSVWSAAQQDPDVVAAVKEALTGEDSAIRRRNELGEDFRAGVRSGRVVNSQTVENGEEDALGKELRRQLRASGIPVAEEDVESRGAVAPKAAEQAVSEDYSPEMRDAMQEAYAEGEISEAEYDDYMDALLEQQGLDGVLEEEQLLREKAEAMERAQQRTQQERQTRQQTAQQEDLSFGDLVMQQMGMGQNAAQGEEIATPAAQARNDNGIMIGGTDNGAGVLHGSGQRNDGARAGEPAGSLAGRAGQDQKRGGTGADRVREKIYRQNLGEHLRNEAAVSSKSQGVTSGTDNATFKIVPESMLSDAMRAKAEQVYEETGKRMVYVVGPIEVVGKDSIVRTARGVNTEDSILVRVDDKVDDERIADHESFHGMRDHYGRMLIDGLLDSLRKEYSEEELRNVLTEYKRALRGLYIADSDLEESGDALEDVDYFALEEMLADAYAGINAFGAGATKYTETVRSYLRDNYISREGSLDSSTEQPTGPPSGKKENTAEHGGVRYSLDYSDAIDQLYDGSLDRAENTHLEVLDHTPQLYIDKAGAKNLKIITGWDIAYLGMHKSGDILGNYHGLGPEVMKQIPKAIQDPLYIIKQDNGRIIAITEIVVKKNRSVIVSIEFDSFKSTKQDGNFISDNYNLILTFMDAKPNYLNNTIFKGEIVYNKNNESPANFILRLKSLNKALPNDDLAGPSKKNLPHRIQEVKQKIQTVLDSTSYNHAAQMESYTENKDSNPELAQKLYDGLMASPYAKQFEEYLKLTEELERLEKESSATSAPQNDGGTGKQFVERASLDDSADRETTPQPPMATASLTRGADGEQIATPAEPARNDSGNREQTNEAEEQKDSYSTLPAKARDYVRRAENTLLKTMSEALSVPYTARREFLAPIIRTITNEYLEKGQVSRQTVDALFQRAYAEGIMADEEYYRQYEHIKKHMRDTAVTLSERDRSDIADFTDFRRQAGGFLKIRNEGGLPVDTAYMELQDMAPELFPDHITHPADQLMHMLEVAKGIEVAYYSLDKYYGDDAADFKRDARHEFEEAVDKVVGNLRDAKRYMEDRSAEIDKAPATVEEAMEAWKALKDARKIYEKAMAKNLLTEHDQRIVGDLLFGGRSLEGLNPETDNIKGIEAVYEAKKEYARLVGLLTEYKRNMKAKLRSEADALLETANEWKDKSSGLAYSRETMRRNVLDIVKDPEVADKILRKYFEPVATAEAAATRFKNKYREKVEELGLSRKVKKGDTVSEAHAVQLLGEALDSIDMIEKSRGRMKQRDGKSLTEWKAVVQELWESSPSLDKGKIEGAVQQFREIYDDLFQQMNLVRVQNGYEPVNYRRGYFPHFQRETTDGILAHFGRALGISTEVAALPTTINGLTHTFRPGIQWFGNALQRSGFATAYDAVEGFDKYIEGVASVIHQTENIQRLRALASQIRYRTSDEGVRKQVDDVLKDHRLSEEEKRAKIDDIYKDGKFTLSHFIVELDEYTNLLANKKSRRDREMESDIGRRFYNVAKWLEQRIAANMIAGNLSSALTNVIPLTQAGARMGNHNLLAGMWNTLRAYVQDDGMVETSTFLTNRRGSDPLVRTWQDKVSSFAGLPMELIDQFVADSIVRGAYYRNIKRGLTEDEALHQADLFAASVMADRSKGAMPTIFNATNPGTKLFTMFQLEVNNQFSEIFKDMPREMRSKGKLALAAKLLQYVLGAFLFNELFEWLFGRRPALDPIGILNEAVGDFSGYELPNLLELGVGAISGNAPSFKTEKQRVDQGIINLGENILGELPFSSALGFVGIGEDSRIPVESALPDVGKLINAVGNSEWAGKKRLKTIADELAKPLTYLAPPFGGNQLSKVVKGVVAAVRGGSYSVDNEGNDVLQYPVYDDPWSAIRAAVMGKSALPTAQDWVDSGFDSFNAKETSVYQGVMDAGVDDREAYGLIDQLRKAKGVAGETTKADERRKILLDSDVSAEAKVVAYCGMVATEKELEWIERLMELDPDAESVLNVAVGLINANNLKGEAAKKARAKALADSALTEAQKIVVVESFMEAEWLTEKGKPTTYAKFRNSLVAGLTVDDYMELYTKDVEMDDFFKYTDSGMSAAEAASALVAKHGLKPEGGAEKVSSAQRWRAVVDSQSDPKDQLAALSVEMTPNQHRGATVANEYGVTPKKYVSFRELLPDYDADENDSYNQKEITAAINAVSSKLALTTEQKAVLWQVTSNAKSAKNNPYSSEIGQKVIEALEKLKEEENDETLSFGDLFMKQVFGNT